MKLSDIQIRDPFFIKEGKEYYLIGTTGPDCWNAGTDFSIYVTKDFINFEFLSKAFDKSHMSDHTQFWAPEIHKYQDKFYMLVSAKAQDRGTYILVSDKINQGYKLLMDKSITPPEWTCLDATLYIEDDEPYLVFSNEWINTVKKDGDGSLYVAKLSKDLKSIVGSCKKIVSGKDCGFAQLTKYTNEIYGYVAEGPFLDKDDNGDLLLYWSTLTQKGYCVAVSRSKNGINGDFVFDKMLFDKDGGHSMVFVVENKKNITFHQPNITPNERAVIFSLKDLNSL